MASPVAFVCLLLLAFSGLCFAALPPITSRTLVAPEYTVLVTLTSGNSSVPTVTWSKNSDSTTYTVSLFAIEEGMTNSSSFASYNPVGYNTMHQNWVFSSHYSDNDTDSVVLTASNLVGAPQITGPINVNISIPLKDTKSSSSFMAGSINVSVSKYTFANTQSSTQLSFSYQLSSTDSDFDQKDIKIKKDNFLIGGAYFGPADDKTNVGDSEVDTEPLTSSSAGWGYIVVDNFPTGSSVVQTANFGMGTGAGSNAAVIVTVVVILLILVIVAAVVGFIIIRRRRRAYSAL